MQNLGDYTLGDTIDFTFVTTEPDTGAPATLSGTPAISAYVGNSTTQITAGITLTASFDSVTGLNHVRAVLTSGNGYSADTDISFVITTGTVDSVSAVGYTVARCSLGRGAAFDRLGAPAGASVSADIAAVKTDTGNLVTRITSTLFTGITSLAEWLGLIAGKQTGNATARTELRATGAGSGTYDETTDSTQAIRDASVDSATLVDAIWDEAISGHSTAGTTGKALTDAGSAGDPWSTSLPGAYGAGTAGKIIGDNITGDAYARLGAPAGASIAADIAAIEAQTDDIGTAGAGLTAVPWNPAWDAEVQSEVQDAIEVNHLDHLLAVDYDPASKPGTATALLNELIESDAGVSRFTANALEQAPTGAGGDGSAFTAIPWNAAWDAEVQSEVADALNAYDPPTRTEATADKDEVLAAVAIVDAVADAILVDTGTTLQAELDGIQADTEDIQARLPAALVSGRMDASVGAMAANVMTASSAAADLTTELQSGLATSAEVAALPTASAIADQVWEEAIVDHSGTAGSTAEALNAAGAAGDPWTTAIPGAYGAGSAGYILGNQIDAAISTRATPAQVNTEADQALSDVGLTTTITGRIDAAISTRLATAGYTPPLDAAGTQAALGMASANMDAQLAAIAGYIDTEVAQLVTDLDTVLTRLSATRAGYLDNLSSGAVATQASVDTIDDFLDTEIASIISSIAALNNISTSDVLTQVNAALNTAISELGVAAPTATPTVRTALMLLYMALRNRTTTTATSQTIQNDAGATIATATVSDDGTTYTKAEFA